MSRVACAVHVVTSDGPAGRHGATATAVTSVTDAPPTLLVCLNLASTIYGKVAKNGVLAVNVLGAEHEALARAFAASSRAGPDGRFEHGVWDRLATGAPTLADALATFDGRVTETAEVGSHTVLFVAVAAVRIADAPRAGLLYQHRSYALPAAGQT